ncbi:zinc-binding dehydrogenase [Amycolatopsis sp.]|jgi:NADPH2:quinone reductase|uniref:zinc-binding dehydrogenase n=1 Tax=Amycolatopsis sp. TaxID=37632 RepID=UPI002E097154|nr:zinc-binding dehydrogenase [Amycolatopsis sp.]
MRVVQVTRFGDPDVLVPSEAPEPVAGPGQVVVDVVASGVLFVETQIRRGQLGEYFDVTPPYVPGGAVAGTVLSAGPDVPAGWIGRRVVADTGAAYVERALVAVDALIEIPAELDPRQAMALFPDGITALKLMDGAGIRPGEWVLITASAGGMGILLIQLAREAGARVVGAARGEAKLKLTRDFGAEAAVDYTHADWAEQVRAVTDDQGADLVFDGVGGQVGADAFGVTADGGRFSAHGAPSGGFAPIDPAEADRRGVTVRGIADVQLAPDEAKVLAERAVAAAAEGRITPFLGPSFPLEKAADAHAAIEARTVIGKVLLTR